eukprot:14094633-Alexandrium_andersonii.AAC.1
MKSQTRARPVNAATRMNPQSARNSTTHPAPHAHLLQAFSAWTARPPKQRQTWSLEASDAVSYTHLRAHETSAHL